MEERSLRSAGAIEKVLLVIAIVGAINWGLIGIFDFNLVDAIAGGGAQEETSGASRVIYSIVGLAGLIGLFMLPMLRARTAAEYPNAHAAVRR